MINHSDILQLCRLCLVEEQVNNPIFEETGNLQGILYKITSCLPVSISKDDCLPKKICETCTTKIDEFYKFWSETSNSEKQLHQWLSNKTSNIKNKMDSTEIKQELDLDDGKLDTLEMSSEAQTYILQQQQLPYTSSSKTITSDSNDIEEPASKRPRRASAMKALEHLESDDDDDEDDEDLDDNFAKAESGDSDKDDEDNYQEGPSTSMDDQPGPSGVGKTSTEAPYLERVYVMLVNEEEENLYCCGKKYSSKRTKYDHMVRHHRPKEYKCDLCEKAYSTTYLLKEHKETHQEKNFLCNYCERKFRLQKHLNSHVNNVHDKDALIHKCNFCEKSYTLKKQLSIHVRDKHGIIHKCEVCLKIFKSNDYLKLHMRQHDDNYIPSTRPCPQCDKKFSTKNNLKLHIENVHQGIRSICEICGKILINRHYLRLHMRVHTNEKPYPCNTCDKKFSTSCRLRVHVRTHTKEKPHICPTCGNRFTQRTSLTTHLKTVHSDERPFKCLICPKKFAVRSLLNTHVKKHGKPLASL